MAKHVIAPAWQTSRGSIVRASGCAVGVPVAGVRVFGETRQNLWQNPSGSYNGVTVTGNADGSMTLDGAATNTYFYRVESHALKPGVTYTLSVDKSTGEGSTGFYLNELSADGSSLNTSHYVGGTTNDALTSTFTTRADMGYVQMGVGFNSGSTPSGTYRVMLNEGSEAQPWCPPGLSSVSELGVVSAGKNFVDASSMTINKAVNPDTGAIYTPSLVDSWHATETKIPCPPPGSSIVCSADSSHPSSIAFYFGDGTFISGKSISKTQAVTVPDGASLMAIDVYKDYFANFQLELGSSATAYEPPHVTTTPIDLSGHQLRSLPDGTHDVLTVDGSGAVVVEPWCYDFVLTGEEPWIKSESRENSFYIIASYGPGFAIESPSDSFVLCDKLPVVGTLAEYEESTDSVLLYSSVSLNVRHTASTLEEFKSWLASNNIHVVVAARAPFDAVPLDPIAPPSIPAADASLWATSDVPCELEATTWTRAGAEQGRQQAAMVKVAQQVRQQAETVAALAAQSLEA